MSREQAIVSLLAETDLCAGLAPNVLVARAKQFRKMKFRNGEMLFSRGDPATHLFLVAGGRIRLAIATEESRELSFRHATVGELCGEIARLDRAPRSPDSTALAFGRVYVLERSACHAQWTTNREVAASAVRLLRGRLRETSSQLESTALCTRDARLARFLLFALGDRPTSRNTRIQLAPGFSQSELTQRVGVSSPQVNATLAGLESAGAGARTLGRLFCNPEKLATIARLDDG
jgi:CRP-like cAMP-binding protein